MRQRTQKLALIAVLVLVASACPSSNDLDAAAKASNELAHDLVLANKTVAELYKAGKIPLKDKDAIAAKLKSIGEQGEKVNNLLIELDKKYPQGTVPPQNAQFIRDNISLLKSLYTEVVTQLLPFGARSAVDKLGQHITTIDKVSKE